MAPARKTSSDPTAHRGTLADNHEVCLTCSPRRNIQVQSANLALIWRPICYSGCFPKRGIPSVQRLGPRSSSPVVPFYQLFWLGGEPPTKTDYIKKSWVPTYSNLSNQEHLRRHLEFRSSSRQAAGPSWRTLAGRAVLGAGDQEGCHHLCDSASGVESNASRRLHFHFFESRSKIVPCWFSKESISLPGKKKNKTKNTCLFLPFAEGGGGGRAYPHFFLPVLAHGRGSEFKS